VADKTPEEMIREGLAHRIKTGSNCAGCRGYHGSESILIACLTRRILQLETGAEFQRLQRFKATILKIKAESDKIPFTKGGAAEARKLADKKLKAG
jgi:hypothetical protein